MVPRRDAPPSRVAIPGHQLIVRRRPSPGDLELPEVVPIDLLERRVPLTRVVARGDRPVRVQGLLGKSRAPDRERKPDRQPPHPTTPLAEHRRTVAARSGPGSSTPSSPRRATGGERGPGGLKASAARPAPPLGVSPARSSTSVFGQDRLHFPRRMHRAARFPLAARPAPQPDATAACLQRRV